MDSKTEQHSIYCRHRSNLRGTATDTSRKMQKYLRLLNLRLDVVVKDICGLTGLNGRKYYLFALKQEFET